MTSPTDASDALVARLRKMTQFVSAEPNPTAQEAADAIESRDREIAKWKAESAHWSRWHDAEHARAEAAEALAEQRGRVLGELAAAYDQSIEPFSSPDQDAFDESRMDKALAAARKELSNG